MVDEKEHLFTTEREDLEGRGTRSFRGVPLRWADPAGRVHACEAAEIAPKAVSVWTLCGKTLPRVASNYIRELEVTCPVCRSALAGGKAQNREFP